MTQGNNNYNIKTIQTINYIPKICFSCKNMDLKKDVVKATMPNQEIFGTFLCTKCDLLMIVKLPPKTMLEELKDAISFIYNSENGDSLKLIGTGFFVSIPIEHISNRSIRYFITAKHVVQKQDGNFLTKIVLRLNKINGGIIESELELDKSEILIHNEPEIDIIAIPVVLKDIQYKSIPIEIIKEHSEMKQLGIGEGDEVFFCGMFDQHIGDKKNEPIFRFGKLSLMSDEKITWKDPGKLEFKTELYLVDCFSIAGNSGSPVFFKTQEQHHTTHNQQSHKIYLAGVLKGTFQERDIIKSFNVEGILDVNIGLTAVSPSQKLKEILYSTKALELRKKIQLSE